MIRTLSSDKQKSQRLLLEAKHAIDKLSTSNDCYCHEVSLLKSQVSNLHQKLSSDQVASSSLNSILEERQREYTGLRKHYQVIEDAIRGTPYV